MNFAPPSSNHVLASLASPDIELLRPHLRPAKLEAGSVLFRAGEPITRVYFPHSGVISVILELARGETTEVAMLGHDSVVGIVPALISGTALSTAIVQHPGTASVVGIDHLLIAGHSLAYRTRLTHNFRAQFAQVQQCAACNAIHSVPSRLARWLLRARDLAGSDAVSVTHEMLAQKLSVRRMSISSAFAALQHDGIVHLSRGSVEIIDPHGLMENACECYATINEAYDGLENQFPKPGHEPSNPHVSKCSPREWARLRTSERRGNGVGGVPSVDAALRVFPLPRSR